MAKVAFSKLGLTKNQEIKNLKYNEQIIEIKQYLPVNEKLQLITNVLDKVTNEHNFINPTKVKVFLDLEIVKFYTNINFTEKQLEDFTKLYDLMQGANLFELIFDNLPQAEYNQLKSDTLECIESYYKYRSSAMGVLDSMSGDYSNASLDLEALQNQISDPESLGLLKDIIPLLGQNDILIDE